jgi:hypothetical protein
MHGVVVVIGTIIVRPANDRPSVPVGLGPGGTVGRMSVVPCGPEA